MTELPTDLLQELTITVENCDCEFVHASYGGDRLQIMIDNADGVAVEDCERVSRQVSPILDVHDFGRGEYVLEVTSPGLDRPLFGAADFERFTGQRARVQWVDGEDKRTDIGTLGDFNQGDTALALIDDADKTLLIPVDAVLTARLEVEL